MKTEFENSIRRFIFFFCSLMEIKIARINPWLFVPAVPSSQTYTSASEVALFSVYVCVFVCVYVCVC